jgi:hypothetical protein
MRPLLLAAVAAVFVAAAPAAHAYPLVCADVVDGNGAHRTACTPFAEMFGRECVDADPGPAAHQLVTYVGACVATPVGTLPR